MPNNDEIAKLRALAGRKGLKVVRATLDRCYSLVLPDGSKVKHRNGSTAFTAKEVRTVCDLLPDRSA